MKARSAPKPRGQSEIERQLLHALRELLLHPEGFLVKQQALSAIITAEKAAR